MYLDKNGNSPRLAPTNADSSTGLYSGSATIKNKDFEEKNPNSIFSLAQQFLRTIAAAKPGEREDLVKDFPSLVAAMKPKAEAYDKATVSSKTRNIIGAPAFAMKLTQPLHNIFFKNKPPFSFSRNFFSSRVQDSFRPNNYNLQGFSFVNDDASLIVKTF